MDNPGRRRGRSLPQNLLNPFGLREYQEPSGPSRRISAGAGGSQVEFRRLALGVYWIGSILRLPSIGIRGRRRFSAKGDRWSSSTIFCFWPASQLWASSSPIRPSSGESGDEGFCRDWDSSPCLHLARKPFGFTPFRSARSTQRPLWQRR